MPVNGTGKGLKTGLAALVAAFAVVACGPKPQPPPEQASDPVTNGNPLTAGEKDMLKSVFGDAIDYDSHQVVLNSAPTQDDDTAAYVVPGNNHNTFFERSHNFSDDYSQSYNMTYNAFWHEMAHIWQHQNPQKSGEYCNRVYNYDLKDGATFSGFCTEQQAAIIADYASRFIHPHAYEPIFYPAYKETADADARLAKVVEDAFPQAAKTRAAGIKFPADASRHTRGLNPREVQLLRGFFGAAVDPAPIRHRLEGKYFDTVHESRLQVERFLYDMTMQYQIQNGGARACDEKTPHPDQMYASRFAGGMEYDARVKFSFDSLCGEAQGRLMADYGTIFFDGKANPWLYNTSAPGNLTAEMKENVAAAVEAKFPEARKMREAYAAGRADLRATVRVLN